MSIQPGDVFGFWNPQLNAYVACQITHIVPADKPDEKDGYAALMLHWTGRELLSIDQLKQVKPLVINFYFWSDHLDHLISAGPIPPEYTYIGNFEVLVEEQPNSYGGWNSGSKMYRQLEWERISEDKRLNFKAASKSDRSQQVEIAGEMVQLNTRSLYMNRIPDLTDYTELDRLPCLTYLTVFDWSSALENYVRTHDFIYKLELELQTAVERIDLQHTLITEFTMKPQNIHELIVPKDMDRMTFEGSLQHDVYIKHEREGRGITLRLNGDAVKTYRFLWGLKDLSVLELYSADDIDLGDVIDRFPSLQSLRMWGKPGYIRGMEQLYKLEQLQMFTTVDMFGFSGEQFPHPHQLPQLHTLWLTSLPDDAAKTIKQAYKQAAKQGLDLSVHQPRKPDWLADNLDNPFRAWDGRDGITPVQAKKAASLYKQIRGQLREFAAQAQTGEMSSKDVQLQLEHTFSTYIEGFNKLDKRKVFIYTEEREEIFGALTPLISGLVKELQAIQIEIDEHSLWEYTDQLRDF
ncbi:hypothetical protein [Paenibacillus macquariensis]|uniref:Gliding motility protein n=1 Tax=Paenibacillus macquariensis TaxID=948756 RepID=A0ABY1JV33_9BACL|nr:hypothetical protein [Paenibacillus macquariensis]MEC0090841.1 hypothetical protein [Paenibacillus macquariensis]OAB34580.1 hypothetical protein PMSM_12010 [Paenibacillus macquariensis subsp. macquariensis]SIQ82376.1 hypothetical protein SAMN05421578_104222 [Paenibacillus macquariensis]